MLCTTWIDALAAQMQGLSDMLLKENKSEISGIILTDPGST